MYNDQREDKITKTSSYSHYIASSKLTEHQAITLPKFFHITSKINQSIRYTKKGMVYTLQFVYRVVYMLKT